VAGGKVREISVKGWNRFCDLTWTADGKGLFVSRVPTSGTMLLYVDLEGRAVVLWQRWGVRAVPSPGGRHLAVQAYALDGNVWMLENF
jgi:hypothetical protein